MLRLRLFAAGLLLLVFSTTFASAQSTPQQKVQAGAEIEAEYMRSAQYDKLLDTMYPPVVEMGGGREKIQAIMLASLKEMDAAGLKFDSVEIGKSGEPVVAGGKMFAVVPQTLRMSGPKMKIEQPGYLLAVSSDKGETWSFIDGAGLTKEVVKKLFPGFPTTLKLPEKKEAKVQQVK